VTPPSSQNPKPSAAQTGTATAFLSMPAARPTGCQCNPNASTGTAGAEKNAASASHRTSFRLAQARAPRRSCTPPSPARTARTEQGLDTARSWGHGGNRRSRGTGRVEESEPSS
jgi:hypothetical protein